jgi:predicted ferric reductase
MTEVGVGVEARPRTALLSSRRAGKRAWWSIAVAVWAILLGNVAVIVWLWWHGGNVTGVHSTGEALTSVARITGLLGAYSALVQVVLLSRIPWLERLAGFDRLSVWHRVNGWLCLDLVVAHVLFSVWGYALLDRYSLPKEVSTMLGGGIYPGMITATVGTALMIAVAATSAVIVKRRLRYEAWYAVHFAAYAGIALAWFHQIPTGNELVLDRPAADYWRSLYAATLAVVVGFRVVQPVVNALRFRLRVAAVEAEGPGVVSVRITGRHLDRLRARPGQFFLWRFLDRHRWWSAHPFSLSAAPDGHSLRITVKALGDFSGRLGTVSPGTRVIAEGPLGQFTEAGRRRDKIVLIAGGIGITPVRALAEEIDGDVVIVYRVVREEDIVFREELESLSRERGIRLEIVAGDHATREGRRLLSPAHLRELVPDLDARDVYVCGPPAMTDAIEKNVRRAGVSRRHVHAERFAL